MAKINLTPKKIYEQEFKTSIRGYDKTEVDEFLDDVIKDYTVYIALVKELQEENAKLKAKATSAPASRPAYASATSEPSHATANIASASNYDILKRIRRLSQFARRNLKIKSLGLLIRLAQTLLASQPVLAWTFLMEDLLATMRLSENCTKPVLFDDLFSKDLFFQTTDTF